MYNNFLVFISLFFLSLPVFGQDCNLTVKGTIIDEGTGEPLAFVNVIMQEQNKGVISEVDGSFVISEVCEGDHHLTFSHIGCDPVELYLHLHEDTTLIIQLAHTDHDLEEVAVEGKTSSVSTQNTSVIRKELIDDNMDENLSGLLENETGVYALKNGNGIAKPVVHGMYGNRLTILNNGIAQSGQQWGNDHSPEIDPLIANKITIIKGTDVLEYGGGNMGGLILVEPQSLGQSTHSHIHGQVGYVYETNGHGHSANVQVQQGADWASWKLNGTLKRSGDKKTPSYYLNNTGAGEANLAFQLEKLWNTKYALNVYASTFNTELGVLRGGHIGNLTDLEQALIQDKPFFTEDKFSYAIDAPKQRVGHHLLKLHGKYYPSEHQSLNVIIATQINDRKEFDVRRGGRSDIPAMSLLQTTFNSDIKYAQEFGNWTWKIGNQNVYVDNTNNPETGIFPLIPDYLSFQSGIFSTLDKTWNKARLSFGGRYDYEYRNAVTFSASFPRTIERYNNHYHNWSTVGTFTYAINNHQSLTFNTGYTRRNPAVNELYSGGLHQGVSGIEEGDATLQSEQSLKTTLGYQLNVGTSFSFNALAYYQNIQDYIFLSPQNEVRLTIRGAFPVFIYEQTDAEIYGLDLSAQITLHPSVIANLKYSFIRGNNRTEDIPLVGMPPQVWYGNLVYRFNNRIQMTQGIQIDDLELELNHRYVFKQHHLQAEQDFVSPPDAYYLLGFKSSANFLIHQRKFRLFVKADNLLNTTYRDYLNRQRYFANDLGTSVTLGLNMKF